MRDMESELKQVKELGEAIGYGHLMSLASALWRKSLKDNGYPVSGAFIPALPFFIRDDIYNNITENKYDNIINSLKQ